MSKKPMRRKKIGPGKSATKTFMITVEAQPINTAARTGRRGGFSIARPATSTITRRWNAWRRPRVRSSSPATNCSRSCATA
jgi:hypothetical protein